MSGFDLKIDGRVALVCGSSAGLGRGCARALALAGARVVLNGRNPDTLARAAAELEAETGASFGEALGDVTTAEGRAAVLGVCPDPDILVNNSAGPNPGNGDFRLWDEAAWHEAAQANMIAPIMMIRALIDGMRARRWGRIINITSSAVKAPLPLLGLSNGVRSGLTGFVAGLAREVAADGITINNLLPGRFETDRVRSYVARMAEHWGVGNDEARERLTVANPMKRFGRPEEFGAMCAFIASDHAAYMTGQNILLDGGEYPGL